jgi:type II secretory pathway pseudopilin PulG
MKSFKAYPLLAQRAAFTLLELLVMLAVLAFGTMLLIPAFAHTRPNAQAAQCLNSMRQLMAAMTMYTHDNSDFFPPNPDQAFSTPGYNWVAGIASGWMPSISAGGSPDAGNPDNLKNSLLANYIRANGSLYRCPFDPRVCPYTGSDSNQLGTIIPVVRSVSMNGGVGTKGPGLGGGNSPVDGPWLNGSHSHTANNPYATFGKMTDFKIVRPSDIWVLVDDDPWTINDASEAVVAAMPEFLDYPSVMDGNATAFSFADAHAEIHKWKSNLLIHTGVVGITMARPGLEYQDWFWWASHASRNVNTGTVP